MAEALTVDSTSPKLEVFPTIQRVKKSSLLSKTTRSWIKLWIIFLVGFFIRLYYAFSPYENTWSNDIASHYYYIEYIVNNHFQIPPRDDGWEFFQQPLYYLIAALFWPKEDHRIVFGHLACTFSLIGLTAVFGAARYLSSWVARFGTVSVFSLTPFFIVHSCSLGTDSLVGMAGCLFYLALLRLNRHPHSYFQFYCTVSVLLLAVATKLNAVALVLAVPWIIWRSTRQLRSWKLALWHIFVVTLLLAAWAYPTQSRAWSPEKNRYVWIHTSVVPEQTVHTNYSDYFASFRLIPLLSEGQASLLKNETDDAVRFSFHTFIYGNFLVGAWHYKTCPTILWVNRYLFCIGLILPFGLFVFIGDQGLFKILRPWRLSFLAVTIIAMLGISHAMIIHLAGQYLETCMSDPRYFFDVVPWIVYATIRGWVILARFPDFRTLFYIGLNLYCLGCAAYYVVLFTTTELPYREY